MGLYAEVRGDVGAAAAPLVLLHGFGGTSGIWAEVLRHLPPDIPVLAYDLPGHGLSLAADDLGGAGRMAKAVAADLAARGIERFHVAGHSLGGAIAAILALRAPEKVASLTLVAPGGFGPEINGSVLSAFALAETAEEMRTAMEAMVAPAHAIPQDAVDAMLAARQVPGARAAVGIVLKAILSETTEAGEPRQGTLPVGDLRSLPMPKYLLWGIEDRILPVGQAQSLEGAAAIRLLPAAGHMLPEECPQEVARLLVAAVGAVAA
ncbi:alpha/beta fold hydrolase [Ciceribacter ferrooxidans]|uniref:Alpha/beta fold hydrolase n=1 Tax=Ciceribacter ferrooxidans TaxID=2509717 RepID=A0A4Q2T1L8_9HYPH|nr:alpha/beta fold hydrolase [Ciceribacter ferrooxidans]RYC11883.1 alpha/beta fold hydrolase [Ciceribacter ferrooxidans]